MYFRSLKSIDACSLLLISLEHIRKKKDQVYSIYMYLYM